MPPTNLTFREPLQTAARHALAHIENLDALPVAATASLETLRARLARPLTDDGAPPAQVIEDLVSDSAGGIVASAGGRFYSWVIGGSVPAALAADWLTSAWDQNAGLYAAGPAAALVEEIAGEWLKELLGIPAGASFAFVTGCQMAHVTCLAAARHAVLERRGWDVEARGLSGAPAIRLLASRERHGSVKRAVRLLGMGSDNLIGLDTDDQGRLDPHALEQALAADPDSPSIVVLQAGELNTGVFDAFEQLIPIAKRYNAWVHVDGAFGLWAAASPRFRHFCAGAGAADSWATDGHKWLNVPYDCGYAFVADPNAHRAAMSYQASYLGLRTRRPRPDRLEPRMVAPRPRLRHLCGHPPVGTRRHRRNRGALLRPRPRADARHRPTARSGSLMGAGDQSRPGAIPRPKRAGITTAGLTK